MATVNTFNPDGSPATTISWPFQTFDGCLHFFDRTLTDMDFSFSKHSWVGEIGSKPKPKHWPNGELRKNKWES